MSKNLAFYLFLICIIVASLLKNHQVISTAATVGSLVFILIYFKDKFKKLTLKALIILFAGFLFLIGILTFIILEGQVFIKNHAFFDGWETIAVIILFAVPLISGTVCIKLLYNRLKAV
ncbi:hypothetical protein MOE37_00345 [Bacillus atrophaeus]|uniref:YoqO family protein n=1 Tax=Bacillus atrophaeus TaxID=1452 RepID=UPI0022819C78|nr:YoqO family protein [Bacillus atrophaeus]MCY8970089.1 hypothetical protein [Bacillus atrophaeus]MCY9159264.1 hypothetical protein [Bacillus atrophaeus]